MKILYKPILFSKADRNPEFVNHWGTPFADMHKNSGRMLVRTSQIRASTSSWVWCLVVQHTSCFVRHKEKIGCCSIGDAWQPVMWTKASIQMPGKVSTKPLADRLCKMGRYAILHKNWVIDVLIGAQKKKAIPNIAAWSSAFIAS